MIREVIDFIKNNKWYVLLVVLLLGLYFYQFHGGLSSDSEKWDHFGSYIGGIFFCCYFIECFAWNAVGT